MMLSSNMPLALTDTRLDRAVPVLDNLIKPHFELTGKGRASPAFSNLSKLDLELAGKDRPMPVSGDLLKLVVELAGKGLSIFGATEKDTPVFGAIRGLYRFRYATHKVHKISLLEKVNILCHHSGQVLRNLHSDTQARKPWFFHALFRALNFGRGGAVPYKSGLSVKAARRSVTVLNTPIALRSNPLVKSIGGHNHA